MPLYVYECANGHEVEELFRSYAAAPDVLSCETCGTAARRHTAYRATVVGPVWEDLETYNSLLLSKKQRLAGAEFKSAKEIARFEQEHGLMRHDSDSPVIRANMSDQIDDHHDIQRRAKEGGISAALDYVDRTEIQAASGLSDSQYHRWKEQTDAVQAKLAADESFAAEHIAETAPGGDAPCAA